MALLYQDKRGSCFLLKLILMKNEKTILSYDQNINKLFQYDQNA